MSRASAVLKSNLDELATLSPTRLLLKYSWPALIAMSLNALYAVVDRAFIGHGCGTDALAGMTLTMPIMMLFGAFGVFVGAGHAAVLSIKLGEDDRVSCEKLVGQLIAFKLAFFFILPPLIFFNLDTVLNWCGASQVTPEAYIAAKRYLKIVLFSHIFSHIAFGLSALQRAEGGAFRSMICMIVGFGLNFILDPIFIFKTLDLGALIGYVTLGGWTPAWTCSGLGLGIAGAAWATNIAMFVSCCCALGYYVFYKTVVRLRWRRIRFYPSLALRAASIGLSPFLQQLMSSLIAIALQLSFVKWVADPAARTAQVASLGVFQSTLILMSMPILGAQQGLQPILGYNYGAKNYKRVVATLKTGLCVTAILTVLAFIGQVVPPFPTWIARIFVSADQPDLVRLAAHDLTISNCMIWCVFINVVGTTFFQSIGRPIWAIILSMLRQGVCLLPVILFLPYFMSDHTFAIWLSMPISDVLCNIATIFPLVYYARKFSRSPHIP